MRNGTKYPPATELIPRARRDASDAPPDALRALGAGRLVPGVDFDWDDVDWDRPTLAELADRVEHQFGETPGLAGIFTLGFGRDEPLTPSDVHEVCEHLGLPAEDFGVDS